MKNRCFKHFYVIQTCLAVGLFSISLPNHRAFSQVISDGQEKIKLDVPYEPSSQEIVRTMLEIAKAGKHDLVYDLGCRDGRIVIAAAQKRGARGVGVDLDPKRIKESQENARKANVTDRVQFFSARFVPDGNRQCDGGHAVSLAGSQFEVTTETLPRAEARDSSRIP
jgi:SAM-dependent methyltransferase